MYDDFKLKNPVSPSALKGLCQTPSARQRLKGYVKPRQPSALKGLCQTPSAVSAQRVMSNPVSRQRSKGYVSILMKKWDILQKTKLMGLSGNYVFFSPLFNFK